MTRSLTPIPVGVLRAEWIKLWSVRSTYWTLLTAALLALGLGPVAARATVTDWANMTAADRATFDPVGTCFEGLPFAVLAFGVLGVLATSTEYATGQIRVSLTAVPRRGMLFAARGVVLGAVSLVLGEALAITTFLIGRGVLSAGHLEPSLTSPDVLRAVLCAGAYLGVVALLGLGLGALLRHSAGALAALFGVVFLGYAVARALEGWSYLPSRLALSNAADVLGQVHAWSAKPRLPSLGLAVADIALYLLLALGLGAWRARRDA